MNAHLTKLLLEKHVFAGTHSTGNEGILVARHHYLDATPEEIRAIGGYLSDIYAEHGLYITPAPVRDVDITTFDFKFQESQRAIVQSVVDYLEGAYGTDPQNALIVIQPASADHKVVRLAPRMR